TAGPPANKEAAPAMNTALGTCRTWNPPSNPRIPSGDLVKKFLKRGTLRGIWAIPGTGTGIRQFRGRSLGGLLEPHRDGSGPKTGRGDASCISQSCGHGLGATGSRACLADGPGGDRERGKPDRSVTPRYPALPQ